MLFDIRRKGLVIFGGPSTLGSTSSFSCVLFKLILGRYGGYEPRGIAGTILLVDESITVAGCNQIFGGATS